jgi:hypothetical protein
MISAGRGVAESRCAGLFGVEIGLLVKKRHHNSFGWQGKTSTTNGVFCRKKPDFRIVEIGVFFYNFRR